MIEYTVEYKLAKQILSPQFAKRSGVSYFNHVTEGVRVMEARSAGLLLQQAYCLHPIVQKTDDFVTDFMLLRNCNPLAVALAVEYRWVANNDTRQAVKEAGWKITLSDFPEVNEMLVADKVQNRKDFLLYYDKTDTVNYAELDRYFKLWFAALGISAAEYDELESKMISKPLPPIHFPCGL